MPAASELVAHARSEEEVAALIGADWLVYQTLPDLIRAVRHENARIEEFDTSCFTGEYVTGDVPADYLQKIEASRLDSVKAAREQKRQQPALKAGAV